MKFFKSSPKPTAKNSSEVTGFDLFYHLTYMSATSAAGISRARVFDLARKVPSSPARFFQDINELADKMRVNYPDACRMVGERVKTEHVRTFLLRLADALRSGEPLAPFLAREAEVQGDHYGNEYERQLESLKKWNDGYTSIAISVALIVVINMVSTMIYSVSTAMIGGMLLTAIVIGFIVAWVLSRAAPPEVLSVPWAKGSREQKRALLLAKILGPLDLLVAIVMIVLKAPVGWTFITVGGLLVPLGAMCMVAERRVAKKDEEVGGFFRSLGGTATSRGTTLGQALTRIELNSFPVLAPDILRLQRRLAAAAKPEVCWRIFGIETGSKLISQAAGIFYGATNLGGDPDTAGILCSLFAMKTSMLRAKRSGVAATFGWLTIVMHAVVSALMVFILEILKKFMDMMQAAMPSAEEASSALGSLAARLVSFNVPQVQFLQQIAVALLVMVAFTNAFAVVASEGTNLIKISWYTSLMLILSGVAFLAVPSLLAGIM